MWSKSFSKTVTGITADQVWKVWIDVNHWNAWMDDIQYAKLEGEFKVGNTYLQKLLDGQEVKAEIIKVEKNKNFTDVVKYPHATITSSHDFISHSNGLEIKTTISLQSSKSIEAVHGPKLIAESIADGVSAQTEQLIEYVNRAD